MFQNVGKKLKIYAKITVILTFVLLGIMELAGICLAFAVGEGSIFIAATIAVLLIGLMVSAQAWMIYAFANIHDHLCGSENVNNSTPQTEAPSIQQSFE